MHLLRYRIFNSFDLAEEFVWGIVVERKLSIEHCVQENTKSPHITWLAMVQPTCDNIIIIIIGHSLTTIVVFIINNCHTY